MSRSIISFNIQTDIKNRLSDMAKENGLTISDLMRMSAMQILSRGIKIEPNYEPSDYLKNAISEGERDLAKGYLFSVDSHEALSAYTDKLTR